MRILSLFLIVFIITLKSAVALDLSIPVACTYGEDCFIESYFDHDSKPDTFTDHTCGKLSSDNHASTDFKLKSYSQMKEGVNVVATDSGVIASMRDGMSDISVDLIGAEAVRGRECGNGIVIEHKRGYVTQYCHLKRNSILVKVGDKVEKGQTIGQVGLSGITTSPYLEFKVTLNGHPVDPFTGEDPVTGDSNVSCDSLDIYPLWDKQTEKKLKYVSSMLLGMGFADKVPHAQGAREGKFSREKIKNNARLLVLWTDIFGVLKDDELEMTITSPDGRVLSSEVRKITSNKKQLFQFVGKKPDAAIWPSGEYVGKVELRRQEADEVDKVVSATTVVEIAETVEGAARVINKHDKKAKKEEE